MTAKISSHLLHYFITQTMPISWVVIKQTELALRNEMKPFKKIKTYGYWCKYISKDFFFFLREREPEGKQKEGQREREKQTPH